LHQRIVFSVTPRPRSVVVVPIVVKLVVREAPSAVTPKAQALAIEELSVRASPMPKSQPRPRDPSVNELLGLDGALERGHRLHIVSMLRVPRAVPVELAT